MSVSRRREIALLCAAAMVTALGMALVCYAMDFSLLRATRGVALMAVILGCALLMDLAGAVRDRTLLPIIAMISGIGVVMLWRLDPLLASKQIVWMMIGSGLMLATYVAISDVRDLRRLKYVAGVAAARSCSAVSTGSRMISATFAFSSASRLTKKARSKPPNAGQFMPKPRPLNSNPPRPRFW